MQYLQSTACCARAADTVSAVVGPTVCGPLGLCLVEADCHSIMSTQEAASEGHMRKLMDKLLKEYQHKNTDLEYKILLLEVLRLMAVQIC